MKVDARSFTVTLAAVLALAPGVSAAQIHTVRTPTVVHRPLVPRPNVRSSPVPRGQHAIFGAIQRLAATTFVLSTRSGRLVNVDYSAAIASGLYSAPLYNGRPVLVVGNYDATGVLQAITVTRMMRIEKNTPSDR